MNSLDLLISGDFSIEEAVCLQEASQSKIDYLVNLVKGKMSWEEENIRSTIEQLDQADPTHGKYLEWLVRKWIDAEIRIPEDTDKITDTLTRYTQLKNSPNFPQELKDINRFRSLGDLTQTIDQYSGAESKQQQFKLSSIQGQEEVATSGKLKLLKVTTPEAMAVLARHTQWCVKDPRWFKEYGPPFYMVLKGGKPYVLAHPGTGQIMDRYDRSISGDISLAIAPVMRPLASQFLIGPVTIYWYDEEQILQFWRTAEDGETLSKFLSIPQVKGGIGDRKKILEACVWIVELCLNLIKNYDEAIVLSRVVNTVHDFLKGLVPGFYIRHARREAQRIANQSRENQHDLLLYHAGYAVVFLCTSTLSSIGTSVDSCVRSALNAAEYSVGASDSDENRMAFGKEAADIFRSKVDEGEIRKIAAYIKNLGGG